MIKPTAEHTLEWIFAEIKGVFVCKRKLNANCFAFRQFNFVSLALCSGCSIWLGWILNKQTQQTTQDMAFEVYTTWNKSHWVLLRNKVHSFCVFETIRMMVVVDDYDSCYILFHFLMFAFHWQCLNWPILIAISIYIYVYKKFEIVTCLCFVHPINRIDGKFKFHMYFIWTVHAKEGEYEEESSEWEAHRDGERMWACEIAIAATLLLWQCRLKISMSIDQMQEDFASNFNIPIQFIASNVLRIDLSTCRNHSIEHFLYEQMQTSSAAAVWWLFKRCSSIKTQHVRCLYRTHTSNFIWNSIPVHAKMMSVLANIFIESKKDWVPSEAQWAFDMSDSYELRVCVQSCKFVIHLICILFQYWKVDARIFTQK